MSLSFAESWVRRRKRTRCENAGHPVHETDEFYWHDPRLYGIRLQKVHVRVKSCMCGKIRKERVKTKVNYDDMVLSDELLAEMRVKGKLWNMG